MALIDEIMRTDFAHKRDYSPTATADFDKLTGIENYKNALFHRLVTVKGSLIHRPDYGVGIQLFQNAPTTIGNDRKIASLIQEEFMKDPRTEEVLAVSISRDDKTPENMKIIVRVKPIGYDEALVEFIPFGEG